MSVGVIPIILSLREYSSATRSSGRYLYCSVIQSMKPVNQGFFIHGVPNEADSEVRKYHPCLALLRLFLLCFASLCSDPMLSCQCWTRSHPLLCTHVSTLSHSLPAMSSSIPINVMHGYRTSTSNDRPQQCSMINFGTYTPIIAPIFFIFERVE